MNATSESSISQFRHGWLDDQAGAGSGIALFGIASNHSSAIHRPWARQWLTGIALLMCVAGMPDWANALPVYAYSKNEISLFSLNTTTVSSPFALYDSSHSASFAGFGTSSRPGGNESGTNNLLQSAVGPGGSPTEDFFAPYGTQGNGYARADTGRSLVLVHGLDESAPYSGNVAEAYRNTPGTASASANTKLSNQITTTGTGEPVTIEFFSSPFMRVMTSTAGDEAVAELALTLSVALAGHTIFTWSPCGNPNDASCFDLKDPSVSVGEVRDPFDLNQTIQCAGGACEKTWPTDGNARDRLYRITLNLPDNVHILASISATEAVRVKGVPEPSTMVLVLIGLALLRWRKYRVPWVDLLKGWRLQNSQ